MESAVFKDCDKLVENFVKNDNPHFESFHVQWKFMMFQHIYTAQSSTIEVLQTTNAIFHMAKRMLCGRDSMGNSMETTNSNNTRCVLRRIGGLYLMYAIYFKQPTKQYVKIQVSLETWKEICDFIESLDFLSTTDEVRYVFWRLYKADAFRFTALDYHVGPENLVNYDRVDDVDASSEEVDVANSHLKYKLQDLFEAQANLAKETSLEDDYNAMKQKLVQNQQVPSQALPLTSIFQEIKNTFDTIHELIIAEPVKSRKLNNDKKCHSTKMELKRKAAFINTCVNATEDTSEEDAQKDVQEELGHKRAYRRMSCKTLFIEELPDCVLNDLEQSSSENEDDKSS